MSREPSCHTLRAEYLDRLQSSNGKTWADSFGVEYPTPAQALEGLAALVMSDMSGGGKITSAHIATSTERTLVRTHLWPQELIWVNAGYPAWVGYCEACAGNGRDGVLFRYSPTRSTAAKVTLPETMYACGEHLVEYHDVDEKCDRIRAVFTVLSDYPSLSMNADEGSGAGNA